MLQFFSRYKIFWICLFLLSAFFISVFYQILKPEERLQVYQPDMVNAELVDQSVREVRKYHRISDFSLVNQNGDTITEEFYKDKIYIADFFFTTCQSICPIMTEHMLKLQEELQDDPELL